MMLNLYIAKGRERENVSTAQHHNAWNWERINQTEMEKNILCLKFYTLLYFEKITTTRQSRENF